MAPCPSSTRRRWTSRRFDHRVSDAAAQCAHVGTSHQHQCGEPFAFHVFVSGGWIYRATPLDGGGLNTLEWQYPCQPPTHLINVNPQHIRHAIRALCHTWRQGVSRVFHPVTQLAFCSVLCFSGVSRAPHTQHLPLLRDITLPDAFIPRAVGAAVKHDEVGLVGPCTGGRSPPFAAGHLSAPLPGCLFPQLQLQHHPLHRAEAALGFVMGHSMNRSVRLRPSPYSRLMRPPPLTMRCKKACISSCGPASSLKLKPSIHASECSRKTAGKPIAVCLYPVFAVALKTRAADSAAHPGWSAVISRAAPRGKCGWKWSVGPAPDQAQVSMYRQIIIGEMLGGGFARQQGGHHPVRHLVRAVCRSAHAGGWCGCR